jgi:hypothetical protein
MCTRTLRRQSKWESGKLHRAALCVVAAICMGTIACDICYDIPRGRRWYKKKGSSCSLSERAVGAFVIANTRVITDIEIMRGSTSVPVNTAVPASYQTLLSSRLQSLSLYNPATQSIFYFQTANPESCVNSDEGWFDIIIAGGSPHNGTLVGSTATESDLVNGAPLTTFQFQVDDLSVNPIVPALNNLGVVSLMVLLMLAGMLGVRRWRGVSSVSSGS